MGTQPEVSLMVPFIEAFKPAPTPAKLNANLIASKLQCAEFGSADKLLGDHTPAVPLMAVPGAGLDPKQEQTDWYIVPFLSNLLVPPST
jgi:hypothetical protein